MIAQMWTSLGAWWRSRTSRERFLLNTLAVLIVFVLGPLWAFAASISFKHAAQADLAEAQNLRGQIAAMAEAGAVASADGSVSSVALAAAEANGLAVERTDARGQRLTIAFEPAKSVRIYHWMGDVAKSGLALRSTRLTRVEDTDEVRAEFELASSP